MSPWVKGWACWLAWSLASSTTASPPIDFSRDIRPILSDHCFRCHGPDEQKREGDLRLDVEADAKRLVEGRAAIVPGDWEKSVLWQRIRATDPDERMPPPGTGRALTADEIERIGRWLREGARWQQHWAFVAPVRPSLPPVRTVDWPRHPIDFFVLAQAEARQMHPQPDADRERLIRRVTLDLTGLPPTPAEVDAFLADDAPDAYERLVERLLASPRLGERLAGPWLDGARYADTSGYQNDGPRSMWRWRDWVIDAFNGGQPFDQFTIEQIAGDLLPAATRDQRIATGFNRNHRGNSEGGIIPDEYQVEYVVDRVDTTFTVWLGLTMGCARCHDHKYDPITQREFYQVFAYFNNIPEFGRAIKEGNSPPLIPAPTPEHVRQLAAVEGDLAAADRHWNSLQPALTRAQRAWERSLPAAPLAGPDVPRGLLVHLDFESTPVPPLPATPAAPAPATRAPAADSAGKAGAPGTGATATSLGTHAPGADRPTEEPASGPMPSGRFGRGLTLDGQHVTEVAGVADFGYFDKFSAALWVRPRPGKSGTLISKMTDEEQGDGWSLRLQDGRLQVHLVKRWLDDAIRVETTQTIPPDTWTHVAFTYDGSRQARGVRIYVNGRPLPLKVHLDLLNQTFSVKDPVRIGGGNGPTDRFSGAIDEVRVYGRCLAPDELLILATPESAAEIAGIPPTERTAGQQRKVHEAFLAAAPAPYRAAAEHRRALRERRQALLESWPTVMVMEERATPRATYVLRRGEYDKRGDQVTAGLPACLPPRLAPDAGTRLGLARWLVSADNPLTARVTVNRVWQMLFGTGLVRTGEDFGVQGAAPSHPELLDWLAVEFVESGWDLKHMLRQLVTCSTYRQSAKADPRSIAQDPENRWLARGPRFRLPAEVIRDQALAVSGLLVERLGGPSVKPYQPADLWKDLATDTHYEQDHGAGLYRRSLYTYWKRTVAPPGMMTFDAAGREACQVRAQRTNTPLQALSLMNDVTYLEAARVLAQRVLAESGSDRAARLRLAFRYCTSRFPAEEELAILTRSLEQQFDQFRQHPDRADALLSHGEFPRDERWSAPELAAYTTVASLLLNLDEVVTR